MEEIRSFGHWLRLRRRALRLTQQELAGLVFCSAELIRKIEAEARRLGMVRPGERAFVVRGLPKGG